MITGISIENFKGISERVTLDLRPITLLFGANSAGKSTILHALHYAREVFERHNLDADETIGGGRHIDLGGFIRFVHRQQPDRSVRMRFDMEISENELPSFNADFELINGVTDLNVSSIVSGISTAAVEITVSWSVVEYCPFVASLGVFLNQVEFAEITAQPNLRETVLSFINFTHPCLTVVPEDTQYDGNFEAPSPGDSVLVWLLHFCRHTLHWSYPHPEDTQLKFAGRCDALPELYEPLDFEQEFISPDHNGVLWQVERALSSLILGPCLLIRDQLKNFRYLGPLREKGKPGQAGDTALCFSAPPFLSSWSLWPR